MALHFDPACSHAEFSVRLLWLVPLRGRFPMITGQLEIDQARQQAMATVHIASAGLAMNRPAFDRRARGPEFFDVARHPSIDFASEPFPLRRLRTGGEIPGALTLRGIRRPASFTLAPAGCASPGRDCPFAADGELRRTDFGMHARHDGLSDRVRLAVLACTSRALPPEPA